MPPYTAKRLFARACYCSALAVLAACASTPPAPPSRVVPLQRGVELPIFILEGMAGHPDHLRQGAYVYNSYRTRNSQLPEEGTRDVTYPPNGPSTASLDQFGRDMDRLTGGMAGTAAFIAMIPIGLAAAIARSPTGSPEQRNEEQQRNLQKNAEFLEVVFTDSVMAGLNAAFVDSFKAALGWTRPNLSVRPRADPYGPEADFDRAAATVHTVNMPALEFYVSRIELLELSQGAPTLVLCAKTFVVGGTEERKFETCRVERWETGALYSKGDDPAAFVAKLTAATARLGQAMAKSIIRE